ncbi:acyl-CoA carboxylase subunit beta [Streptomyces sp. HNM0645]|uniref:acyl-CoA carboxylase subunit beta n=1 Tax=Streptomyces sp. HNM0645 TaxID=2782343 RepID=UPI0024B6CFA8|nr:acyl-CoA carboxylase subunit beta [Streptomyces sp. HNM0645]MDI9889520.1 acyl-CoA carboxylase subunit beta [Streptomyces sp. HNM0645]
MATARSNTAPASARINVLPRRTDQAVRTMEERHAALAVTARERVAHLLDANSFAELDNAAGHLLNDAQREENLPDGDEVVTGYGTIDGRPVAVYALGRTVPGGALGEAAGRKIVKVMDFALKTGCPIIGVNDAGRARTGDGGSALGVYGEIFRRHVHSSGVIPQISLIMGSCAGGAVHSPALTDFTVMTERTSHTVATGPDVSEAVTGEDVDLHRLGGARRHTTASGVAHYMAGDGDDAVEYIKSLLSHLPSNNLQEPPVSTHQAEPDFWFEDTELDTVIPDSPNQPYDVHHVIEPVLDDREFLETQPLFAPNIVTGFGRVEGRSVGIVANQPMQLGGCLDMDACEKAARFIRTCDAFNVPVLTFVDVPGFLPGAGQEHNGIIRHGAKLIYAYAEATVPLITVITRKAYGSAYDVMGSTHLGADLNLAWPTAQIAAAGAQSTVNAFHLSTQAPADAVDPVLLEEERAQLTAEYEQALLNPHTAARQGNIDAVIRPSRTRQHIAHGLRALRTKRETLPPKKHGGIPL